MMAKGLGTNIKEKKRNYLSIIENVTLEIF